MSAETRTVPIEEAVRTFSIKRDERIEASIDIVFETILEQIGPMNERPDHSKMPLVLEAWPGGRWYRDLGKGTGHMWGHVQAIKAPELLELYGPMFMSFPATSNVQFRLMAEGDATRVQFTHAAMGVIPEELTVNVGTGWDNVLQNMRKRAEQRQSD